ncbi:MAG: hypothetical protein RLZZ68_1724, partial [Bacteroidota bacterium]
MDFDKLTAKSQEALHQAQRLAQDHGHKVLETSHVFLGMMEVDKELVPRLMEQQGLNVKNVTAAVRAVVERLPKVEGGDFHASNGLSAALRNGINELETWGDSYLAVDALFYHMCQAKDALGTIMKDAGINTSQLKKDILTMRNGEKVQNSGQESTFQALEKFAKNLNEMAAKGKLDPVIGRDEEIRRVLQILTRRTKNNPILIGEPGVGKTAIAEGLAHRIISGDVPDNLKSKVVFSLDMGALVAGAKYKGEFEERLKSVVKEVINSDGEIILFIDEIHTLVGAGGGEGAMDAANILKPALARGELRAVGATTLNEYQKYFEKDKALVRRFQTVLVDEPDTEDAIAILRGIKEKYENHHKVIIKDAAIIAAVELSQRYIS